DAAKPPAGEAAAIEAAGDASPVGRAAQASARERDWPRVVLVNPPRYGGIPVVRLYRSEYLYVQGNHVPAMDLGYFAAAARGRAHVFMIDANGDGSSNAEVARRLEELRPDVVVVKGVLNILEHDLAAAREHKRAHPHVRIVLSCRGCMGAEPRVFEEFPDLDAIARGEIDAFARDIAARPDLAGIRGLARPDAPASEVRVVEDLDEVPMPDLEVMPRIWHTGFNIRYYGVESGYFLTSSRGCPYGCTFCMVGGIEGRPFRYRRRDPANVVEEVRILRERLGVRDFYVFDEIFTMPGHGERVCEALLSAGEKPGFVCEGKPDLVNAEMLALMKRAGCRAIYYGVESGDDALLSEVDKGHTDSDARRAVALTREAGILAGAYVILGLPGESVRSFLKTASFLFEARPELVRYDFLLPYPTTILHSQMKQEGLLDFAERDLDRRISPYHDAAIRIRSRHLSQAPLRWMDGLLKLGFADELARSPLGARAQVR
ncbi:MAG: B12-binding domain-containing radical SAM protein, partial [Sandaracinaceae bacterium]|nr:B12-binding domain-containing radical SAM protein [Sandaracinaceae bacterium]